MNSRKVIMIFSFIILMVFCTCSFAIVLPGDTYSADGVVSKIDSGNVSISINSIIYYFKDASDMEKLLKANKISEDIKVVVLYKTVKGKKLIINIMKDDRKSAY